MRISFTYRLVVITTLSAIAVCGCGYKGDLYLPEKPTQQDQKHPQKSEKQQ